MLRDGGQASSVTKRVSAGGEEVARGCAAMWKLAKKRPDFLVSGVFLLAVSAMAVVAPLAAPHDPVRAFPGHIREAPSRPFLLGTDLQGRDVLSRVMHGARVSLMVSLVAVGLGTTAAWGVVSGFKRGVFDLLGQRVVDILLSLPAILLAMSLTFVLGGSIPTVIIAIAVTRAPIAARVIRSVSLSVAEYAYAEAARALGASDVRVMLRHVAPNCLAPYMVLVTTHLGAAIVLEATLSFLGAGIPPPTPTWGNMLAGAFTGGSFRPLYWVVIFPGVALTLTVLAFNLLGDAVRDVLDPRLRGRM